MRVKHKIKYFYGGVKDWVLYPIRNTRWFFRRVIRLFHFIPHVWRGYDFDYRSSVDLFTYQLERTAKFFESDKPISADSQQRAREIRTAIRLLKKVYEEDYGTEYRDKVKQKFGEDVLDSEFVPIDKTTFNPFTNKEEKLFRLKYKYDDYPNRKEIEEYKHTELIKSNEKQNKAHRILWKYIEHKIRNWWD